MLHIYARLAEKERALISERTTAALAAAKPRRPQARYGRQRDTAPMPARVRTERGETRPTPRRGP